MSIESSPEWRDQQPLSSIPAPRRRWPWILLVFVVVAVAGAGGAYALLNAGLITPPGGHEATDAETTSNDKAVMTDLLAAQQKTSDDLAAIGRAIADQQEQLKAIVSQLAGLSSKIDVLQGTATPSAPSFPAPAPAAAAPSVAPTRAAPVRAASPAAPKPKKPPHAAASTGPISVGGAPLDTAPDATTR